jgi:hypothetical protein
MNHKINYIKHQKYAMEKFYNSKLLPTHISIYNALFMLWNNAMFPKDMSIIRDEVMQLSKVKSNNTYVKCLRDLDEAGFIKYKPSYNPLIGSVVSLVNFCHSDDMVLTKYYTSSEQGTEQGTEQGDDISKQTIKLLNLETIKLINSNWRVINENLKDWLKKFNSENKEEIFDFEKVSELFNKKLKTLPSVKKLSEKRKSAIQARIKEYKPDDPLIFFSSVFDNVFNSNFLMGDNEKGWTADFDWIFNPNNFLKIIENNYTKNGNRSNNNGNTSETNLGKIYADIDEMYGNE